MSSENSQARQLVEEGIAAIQAGDKAVGRGKLEAAVKIDLYNEKAWLWLAKVVPSIEEKRTCLGNVILINPANKEAQAMLEKLEGAKEQFDQARATSAGRRRNLRFGIIGLLVLGILILLFLAMSGGGNDEEAVLVPTVIVSETPSPTENAAASQTAQASITPTITLTPTVTLAVLGGTWTPTPAPSNTPPPLSYPAPPSDLSGRIIMQSGRVPGDNDNQPIVVLEAANPGGAFVVTGEGQRGQLPILIPGQNRFVWAQYSTGTRSLTLQLQSFGVPNGTSIVSFYEALDERVLSTANYPAWGGNVLAFAGKDFGGLSDDLWLLELALGGGPAAPAFGQVTPVTATFTPSPTASLTPDPNTPTLDISPTPTTPPPSPLKRLTENAGNVTWSAFDPTNTALVFVAENDGLTDLWVLNINSLQLFRLTANENTLIESAPDWGPENTVVFSASRLGESTRDIYIMNADGQSEPEVLIDLGPQDIQPRFSPDGRYVVFSSDVNGSFDVYIVDRQTQELYQVTADSNSTDIANDWTN
jgi:hypothetical protein